jgi:predicted nucleic acid-binding protein
LASVRSERVIVDAGPLVAILNRHDSKHAVCHEQGLELPRPFITTWPVIAEAAWLLRKTPGGVSSLLRMVAEGLVECYSLDAAAAKWMDELLLKYADQNIQLADASLLYVAENEHIESIFTLDRRDFLLFRLAGNRPLRLLPEP